MITTLLIATVLSSSPPLWIRAVTVVSPERVETLKSAHVVIEDGRIVSVSNTPPRDFEGRILEGKGRFLIPGLIDSHVHLQAIAGMTPLQEVANPELAQSYLEQLPRSYLYYGFTALIDLNVLDREFLDSIEDSPLSPDVFDCDGALVLANGYPMSYFPHDERFQRCRNFLYDHRQEDVIPDFVDPDHHTPEAAVARVVEAGGVGVKTHFEKGFGSQRNLPTYTASLIAEVLEASHEAGLPVLMHANSLEAYRFAVDSRVDILAHGLWNWQDYEGHRGSLPEAISTLIDDALDREIAMMPTVRVMGGLHALFDRAFLDDTRLRAVLPQAYVEWLSTEEGGSLRKEIREGDFDGLPDSRIREIMETTKSQGERVMVEFLERGGTLLMGSDTPAGPSYGNPPGLNGNLEMRAWARAGVGLRELLAAATVSNARAFGLDDDYGTVEVGRVGHVLLLEANPWETIEAYETITHVVLRGQVWERDELRAE